MENITFDSIWTFPCDSQLKPIIIHKKKVHFAKIAYLILIPSREEYKHLRNDLWYNVLDYQRFRFMIN
jgi:hypothetical protein